MPYEEKQLDYGEFNVDNLEPDKIFAVYIATRLAGLNIVPVDGPVSYPKKSRVLVESGVFATIKRLLSARTDKAVDDEYVYEWVASQTRVKKFLELYAWVNLRLEYNKRNHACVVLR